MESVIFFLLYLASAIASFYMIIFWWQSPDAYYPGTILPVTRGFLLVVINVSLIPILGFAWAFTLFLFGLYNYSGKKISLGLGKEVPYFNKRK